METHKSGGGRRQRPPQMLTAPTVAAALGVSLTTINRAARAGYIPSTQVGRQRRFSPSVVDILKNDGLPSRGHLEADQRASEGHCCRTHGCAAEKCRCATPPRRRGR